MSNKPTPPVRGVFIHVDHARSCRILEFAFGPQIPVAGTLREVATRCAGAAREV
jgi:hypothetical protein